ncbi:hypothetical protein BDV97DRAFT_366655 [Delphinella strobiligena]|nr:hypothetical protein BDV97DRAFT_366655 [Delphinella strobiligena]
MPRTTGLENIRKSRLNRDANRMARFIKRIKHELDTPYLTLTWIAEQIETLQKKSPPNQKAIMEFQECHKHVEGLQKAAELRLPRADRRMARIFEAFEDITDQPEVTPAEYWAVLDEVQKFLDDIDSSLCGFRGAPRIITTTLKGWMDHFAKEKKNLELWAAEVERLATATATFQESGPALTLFDPSGEQADFDSATTGKVKTKKHAHTNTSCKRKRRNSLCPHDRRIDE